MSYSLTLADILTSPVITASPDQYVSDALQLMLEHGLSAVVVVDGKRPVGIFTERDAVLFKHRGKNANETSIAEVMGSPVLTAMPDLGYREGYKLIADNCVRYLVVIDEFGFLLGLVSEGDFLEHIGADFLVRFKEVSALMTKEVLTLTQDASVDEGVRLMANGHASCVVIENKGHPVGLFTERDLINLQSYKSTSCLTLADVMTKQVHTVSVDTVLPLAIQVMDTARVRRLVVVSDNGSIRGLVTRHDIVKQLNDSDADSLRKALAQSERELESARTALQVANKLQATEERLQSIVETIPCGIQDSDCDGAITFSNSAYHHILGYSKGEFVGKKVWDFADSIDAREAFKNRVKCLFVNKPEPERIVITQRRKDGLKIVVEIDWNYKCDEHGSIVGITSVITDITDKKDTDERLQKIAADLSRAQSVANLGNWTYRVRDGMIEWSDHTYKIFGRKPSSGTPSYDNLLSWFRSDDREAHDAYMEKMVSLKPGKEMEVLQHRLTREDGEQRWIEVTSECEFDELNQPKLFFGTILDITDRKNDERSLRDSEERFRTLYQKTPVMMQAIDADFKLLEVNDSWLMTLGYAREEVIGRDVTDFMTDKSAQQAKRDYMPQLIETGEVKGSDIQFYTKTGETVDVDLSATPEVDDDGVFQRALGFMVDVTDRNRAQLALVESESRLRTIFDTATDGILLADIETKQFIAGNPAITRMLGYSQEELVHLGVASIHPQDSVAYVQEQFERQAKGGVTIVHDIPVQKKDGSLFYADISAAPISLAGRECLLGIFRDITDRRNSEKALKASEAKFRALFEQAGGYCMIMDPETDDGIPVIIDANEAACLKHGYTREELLGRPISDLEYKHSRPEIKRKTVEIIEGEPLQFDSTHIRKDGTTFSVAINANRICIDGLQPLIFTTEFDITERVLAEESLRRYEKIVSSSKDMLALLDRDFTYIAANPAYLNAFGLPYDEVIGHKAREVIGEEFINDVTLSYIDRCFDGEIVNFQQWFDYPGLGLRYTDVYFYPYRVSNGDIQGFVVTARDETQREQAEAGSRETERQLKEAQKIAHLGNWEYDVSTRCITCSDEVFRIFGVEPRNNEIAFEDYLETVHPDDKLDIVELAESMPVKQSVEFQHRLIRPSGEVRWISGGGKTKHDSEGNLVHIYGTFQDVTNSHHLENQLHQAQKLESVGRLAGGVAHDFNNMLAVILGHTDLILAKTNSDNEHYSNLTQINTAARRSADLTKQLLAFARQQPVSPKVIALNENVLGMTKMLQRLIGEDINFLWLPARDLWAVEIDPSQIDQILANLCVNARDAISGVGKVTIETKNAVFDEAYCSHRLEYQVGEYVMLAVNDTGCGMDEETLENVFEPFYSTKAQGEGTGLGLATVYGVVRQNGGFIDVVSEPELGTTFKIYLPRHTRSDDSLSTESDAVKQIDKGDELILLVEDEPLILELTKTMLEMNGYTVVAAGTPAEAMHLADKYRDEINLFMSDVVMPEMNGLDLSKKIIEHYPNIKCLFMSGYTADVITDRGVVGEGTNFIQKPFSMEDLTNKVRAVLDSEK